jgi:putative ABC transport system ATP-binding protein
VIETRDLRNGYDLGEVAVNALNGVSVSVKRGEFVAVMGASGSGKSTFMNMIGYLDKPASGSIYLEGQDVATMWHDQLAAIRNKRIGFVFQGIQPIAQNDRHRQRNASHAGRVGAEGRARSACR